MPPKLSSQALRLFLVVALFLAALPVGLGWACGAQQTQEPCSCCPALQVGCCEANHEAPSPLALHGTPDQQALRDALSPLAPLLLVLPPAPVFVLPKHECAFPRVKTAQSRRSQLCVRIV